MILEVASIEVLPQNHNAFEVAVKKGVSDVLSKATGFLGFQMRKGIEQPDVYVLNIEWATLEDHTIGFRQGELFPLWRGHIGEFFAKPPVVEHWYNV
jgi:heme-degrading monooxygenase HmoA